MQGGGPMATVASSRSHTYVGTFYIAMAAVFIAIAFGGFLGTYWLQLARGTFVPASPLLHLHGFLFSAWTLFFLSQALLVGNRKLRSHRYCNRPSLRAAIATRQRMTTFLLRRMTTLHTRVVIRMITAVQIRVRVRRRYRREPVSLLSRTEQ